MLLETRPNVMFDCTIYLTTLNMFNLSFFIIVENTVTIAPLSQRLGTLMIHMAVKVDWVSGVAF